jgi:hypothetical protein
MSANHARHGKSNSRRTPSTSTAMNKPTKSKGDDRGGSMMRLVLPCTPHAEPDNAYKCAYHPRWPWLGHLCPAHREQADLGKQLTEAWEIINVLTMMDIDRKEPWPRALEWLALNENHRRQNAQAHGRRP